ncbi:Rac GTPase-activating protein 1 [Fasciola gigantica]|uniref:Rac GTPase-activating protein 1 n=1 Tax=Fasciola gigantica TaxID=46835 RepID=A0A504Z2H6_FASGI|nr:Rac GTPase-activating protein 1 [Fasciola gigantica]
MASSKVIKRKRKVSNCVVLFDSLLAKFSKLSSHSYSAQSTSVKLLDLLCSSQNQWSALSTRLRSSCKLLDREVSRLRKLHEETTEMLCREKDARRRAERTRDSLRRKINAIREVLMTNDVDEAKRRLEDMELSALTPNKSFNNTRLDHSAGSLLDPVNVSVESTNDEIKRSPPWYPTSSSNRSRIHSARLSKFRSSSVPKFTSQNSATVHDLRSEKAGSAEAPRISRKRSPEKSDDSYFGVEVKRSVFTLPAHQSVTTRNMVPSTVTEESSSLYSSDAVNLQDSDDALHVASTNQLATPETAMINRLNRPHNFIPRSVLRMEACNACGRRIPFGKTAHKCSVCGLLVHSSCQKRLAQTCVPPSATRTPLSTMNHPRAWATSPRRAPSNATTSRALVPALPFGSPKSKRTATVAPPMSPTLSVRLGLRNVNLTDFCPADQFPRIPALIIHCVTEVVARGMNTVGLYRVSGSEKQVRDLYDKFFRTKMTPGLALVEDIHVVCGCLKLFLRNLSEPLVTFEQRPVLAAASERVQIDPEDAVHRAIDVLDCLPAPNRDTLSYIVLHLKLIARTPACQMGEDNLAKIFGPVIVGYSCPEPQLMQTVNETRTQKAVVKLLFSVPDHIYSTILSNPPVDTDSEVEQKQTTYFSPLSAQIDHENIRAGRTPMRLRQTPRRLAGSGLSSRSRLVPSFLSSSRIPADF